MAKAFGMTPNEVDKTEMVTIEAMIYFYNLRMRTEAEEVNRHGRIR